VKIHERFGDRQLEAVSCWQALRCASGHWTGLPEWLRTAYENGDVIFAGAGVKLLTAYGWATVPPEDWILRDAFGMRGCSAEAFALTYEPVGSDA
jgi:hypothetical protein